MPDSTSHVGDDSIYAMLDRTVGNLLNHGVVPPVIAIIDQDGGIEIYDLVGKDAEERRSCATLIGRQIQSTPLVIITIMEAWVLEVPIDSPMPDTRPSQHPDRFEAISIAGIELGAEQFFVTARIARDENDKPVVNDRRPPIYRSSLGSGQIGIDLFQSLIAGYLDGAITRIARSN